MTRHSTESRLPLLVLRSIWYWDLWVAIVIGIGVYIGFVRYTPMPRWEWILPVIPISVAFLGIVWHQWNNLRSRLQGSSYGELLRIVDKSETEVRLPYVITLWVAVASIVSSTITAIVIEDLNDLWAEVMMLSFTGFFATWLLLSVVSLFRLSTEHDKKAAIVESLREQLAAEQRRSEREIARSEQRNGPGL